MLKLFKTLIILYSTIATVSAANIQFGEDYPFNPLTYGNTEDPVGNYDVIVPKQIAEVNETPVYQKQLRQAITEQDKLPVYTNSDGSVSSTTYGENDCTYKIFVQQCDNTTTYEQSCYEYDNGMPVITKALKSDFVTPYKDKNGQDVFRQKIKNQNTNSDVILQFDNDGKPIFIKENDKEKQATSTNIPLYTDNNGTVYFALDIMIQQYANSVLYPLAYDNDNKPIVTIAKTKWGNDYFENGTKVFRQKSLVEFAFEFNSDGTPILIMDGENLKQAVNKQNQIVYYSKYNNATFSTDPNNRSPIYIQSTNPTLTLAYDSNGNPQVTEALKSDFVTPYKDKNGQDVFRQKFVEETEFKFDNEKPVFYDNTAVINNSESKAFVVCTDATFASYDIKSQNEVNPILIQQWYPTSDTSYNTTLNLAIGSDNMPIIKPVYCYDNNEGEYKPYTRNEMQVYRQITTYENNFVFNQNNGAPMFMEDQNKLVPYFKKGENYMEVDDVVWNVGQLVKVTDNNDTTTIQAYVDKDDNTVKWYDLEMYIANYLVENSNNIGGGINISENINFIVKNDYTLSIAVSFKNHNAKLFIPKNITLDTQGSGYFNGSEFSDILLFGAINNGSNQAVFASDCNKSTIIMGPEGVVNIPYNILSGLFQGGSKFPNLIIYPGFQLNDEIFFYNDQQEGTNYNKIDNTTTYYSSEDIYNNANLKHLSGTTNSGLLYLNRFTEDDADKAKLLKATFSYNVSVVLPRFLDLNNGSSPFKRIGNKNDWYIDFFPNLIFLGGDLDCSETKVPMTAEEFDTNSAHKYFFEDVYSTKKRYTSDQYEVDFVPDDMGRNVLSLVQPEIETFPNPFEEYDKSFIEYVENKVITEGEIKKPTYEANKLISGGDYNPAWNELDKKYWNTDTLDGLFVDESGNSYTLSKNIPAELNVGLIGNTNISIPNTYNNNEITLNGNNSDFNGTLTVPNNNNTTTINLNNENALVSINQYEKDNLSSLTYNIGTNITWDISKTENLLSQNTITLDMKLKSNDNVNVITFKDLTNKVSAIKFNADDNTAYNGYFIPSPKISTLVFKDINSIVKVPSNLKVIFTDSDTVFFDDTWLSDCLLKRDNYLTNNFITNITLGNTTYTKNGNGTWANEAKQCFCTLESTDKTEDKRYTIEDMRKTYYYHNNKDNIGSFFLNTTNNGYYNEIIGSDATEEEKTKYDINQLYYNAQKSDEKKLSNNMPPILNIGLVNNGPLTIVNSDPNNTKVEINGINYGIRHKDTMNLLCWPNYNGNDYHLGRAKEINSTTISAYNTDENKYKLTPIGKPYTGILTVPNKIKDIEFRAFSFIPNIYYEPNKKFNQNYTFKGNDDYEYLNIVQWYDTKDNIEDNIEKKTGSKILLRSWDEDTPYYDYKTIPLELTLNKLTVNERAKVILNNAHISIKAPQQNQEQGGSGN